MRFEDCFERLMAYEGVFGGMRAFKDRKQNWGISQEMADRYGWQFSLCDMTLGTSMDILREQLWVPTNCADLPEPIRLTIFDCAYQHGITSTNGMLMSAVGAKSENSEDPWVKKRIEALDPYLVRGKVLAQRLTFLSFTPDWAEMGQGWTRRIADILEAA